MEMALNTDTDFGISQLELTELMSRRREDAVAAISERGGLAKIARQLRSDLQRGISTSSREAVNNRCSHFGANRLPQHQRKSMPRAVCESCLFALQDKLLVMFISAALLSMILGLAIEQKKVQSKGCNLTYLDILIFTVRGGWKCGYITCTILRRSRVWYDWNVNNVPCLCLSPYV